MISDFFSIGGGEYFWGSGRNTTNKYGYPIRPVKLPISREITLELNHLYSEWAKYADDRNKEFPKDYNERISKVISIVKEQLGPNFNVHTPKFK